MIAPAILLVRLAGLDLVQKARQGGPVHVGPGETAIEPFSSHPLRKYTFPQFDSTTCPRAQKSVTVVV